MDERFVRSYARFGEGVVHELNFGEELSGCAAAIHYEVATCLFKMSADQRGKYSAATDSFRKDNMVSHSGIDRAH